MMTSQAGAEETPVQTIHYNAAEREEYPIALAARIGAKFDVRAPLEAFDFPEKGNINLDTFCLVCGPPKQTREYILQRINQEVFCRPDAVMAAMLASLESQRQSVAQGLLPVGREWDVITLLPTRDGSPYLTWTDRRGTTYWRLMVRIPACQNYKSLSEIADRDQQLFIAEEAGRGLAMYGDFTSSMDVSKLVSSLPGYRDTGGYYNQFKSIIAGHRQLEEVNHLLPEDELVRESTKQHFLVVIPQTEYRERLEDRELQHYIELVRNHEELGLTFTREMESCRIRTVGIHGDTKLENFLFSQETGRVKALVDLDTIMPHTWLSDWGDMMRSLANVAGEKETDLGKVRVDMEIYEAVARGFLSTARKVTDAEIELMVEAVQIIALELGMRFLTDYLRGDSYFKLGPNDLPDLNKVRAMVQLSLFEKLQDSADQARNCIDSLRAAKKE